MASMLRAHLAALTLWALACLCISSPANVTGDDVEFLETEFRCEGKSLGAFYADKSTGCRMFHVCARGDHDQLLDLRFACLKGQAFDVQAKACDSAENIVCNDTDVLAEDGSSNAISSNGDANWSDLGAVRVRRQLVPFFSSNNLPQTVFSCRGRKLGRFYADTEAGCQLFHVCALGETADELLDFQFLCLNGTVFDDTVQRCLPFAESTCNTKVQDIAQSSTTPAPSAENATTAAAVVVAAALPTRREQNEAEATTSAFLEEEYIDEEFTEEVPLGDEEFIEGEVVEESGLRTKRQSPLHSYDALPETTFSCAGKVPGGYYADVEAGCQMYHVCAPGPVGSHHSLQDFKFLCSNGTIFSQNTRACQTWYTVDCAASPSFFRLNDDLSQFQEEQVTTSQTFADDFAQVQVQEEQQPRPQRPQRPRPQVQQQQPQQQVVQQQRPQVQQRRPQVQQQQQVRPQVQQQQEQPQVPQVQQRRRQRPQAQQRPQVINEQAFPRDGFLDSQLALLEQTEPVLRLSPQRTRRPVEVPVDPVQEVFQEERGAITPQRRRPVRPLLVEESISSVTSSPPTAISTLREQEIRQQVQQMAQEQVVSIPEEEGFATTSTFDETLKALVQTQREADARSRASNRQRVVQEEVRAPAPAPARRRRIRPSQQNLEDQRVHGVQQLEIVRDDVRDHVRDDVREIVRDTFTPQRFEIEPAQRVQPAQREQQQILVQRQERPRPQSDPNFDNFASQVQALFTQSPRQVSHQATRAPAVSFVPSFSSLPSFPVSPASTLSVNQLPNLNDLPLFLPQPEQRQPQRSSSSIDNGRQQLQFILQPISSGAQSFQPTPVRFQSSGAGRGRGADDGHVIVLHRGLVVEGNQGNGQLARFAGGAQTGGSGFEFGTGVVPQNLRFRRETSHRQMRIVRAVPVAADFPKTTFSCHDKVPGRFYADAETNCQVFHLCVNRLSSQSFMCRNGTVFDQRSQACDDQTDALNCVDDPQHYGIGEAFGSSVPVLR